jgi:hypothetical protein
MKTPYCQELREVTELTASKDLRPLSPIPHVEMNTAINHPSEPATPDGIFLVA